MATSAGAESPTAAPIKKDVSSSSSIAPVIFKPSVQPAIKETQAESPPNQPATKKTMAPSTTPSTTSATKSPLNRSKAPTTTLINPTVNLSVGTSAEGPTSSPIKSQLPTGDAITLLPTPTDGYGTDSPVTLAPVSPQPTPGGHKDPTFAPFADNRTNCFETNSDFALACTKYKLGYAAFEEQVITEYGRPESWCTTYVTDMAECFRKSSTFNENISAWDTSRVTRMDYLFTKASAFNQPLYDWDVSRVTSMYQLFLMHHRLINPSRPGKRVELESYYRRFREQMPLINRYKHGMYRA